MNLADIPLAAKVSVGAIGGLVLLGGGIAAGAHLGNGGVQASSSSAVVATPSPIPSASARARNTSAQVVRKAALAAEAQVLGVTTKQLNADFKSGTTVQQLATAKGLSQAQFQTQFQAALQSQLDQAVSAGTVTQAQEQQAVKRLTAAIPNWSQVGGAARKTPSPSPTPTPTP
jgi:cell division septum initiation protein DivIVA